MEALETSLRRRTSRRRRRRALFLVGLAGAFIASAVFFLDNSGTAGPTITAAPGTSNGNVAAVYTGSNLSGGTTTGHTTSGLPVARVVAAQAYVANSNGKNVRISIAWTNASNSALNGKDVIGVGLYYPVATPNSGSCTTSDTLKITDSDSGGDLCLRQDKAVTGKNVDTGSSDAYYGLIPIVASLQTGVFIPSVTPPSSPSTCSADTGSSTAWCQPSGSTFASDTSAMYLVAQVLNPAGHAPPGQQPSPGDLTFFVQAKAVG